MKKIKFIAIFMMLMLCLCFAFVACTPDGTGDGNGNNNNGTLEDNNGSGNDNGSNNTPSAEKILIAFFSRADENYSVGYIEKGNTHIIAEIIAEYTDGELFHIERSTPYPKVYSECTEEAQREKNANARPKLLADIDITEYDTIFLGYPNWWGDMPMPVYTFIESHNWNGKTVIPFCTNAGSGLSNTVSTLRSKLSGATVLNGLAIAGTTAQNNRTASDKAVSDFLKGIGLI